MTDIDMALRHDMLAWAKGDRGAQAGIQLMIDHGWLPEKMLAAGHVMKGNGWAAPLWEDAFGPGSTLDISGSEEAILAIAGSLAGKLEISLGHMMARLDEGNQRHVKRAVALFWEL